MQLFHLITLLILINLIQNIITKKIIGNSGKDHNFLIDQVAKYLPDNFLQNGIHVLKNIVYNNFDLSKPFECDFRCPNGSKL